jgi:hypothetical protein
MVQHELKNCWGWQAEGMSVPNLLDFSAVIMLSSAVPNFVRALLVAFENQF